MTLCKRLRTPNSPQLENSEFLTRLEAFKAGDLESGNRIIATIYAYIWSVIARRIRNEDLASDAFNDAWICCRNALHKFDPSRGFSLFTFMYRTITNSVTVTLRSMETVRASRYVDVVDPVTGECVRKPNYCGTTVVSLEDESPSGLTYGDMLPDENLGETRHQRCAAIVEALLPDLNQKRRHVVSLYFGLDAEPEAPVMSESDVGHMLGVSKQAVHKNLHDAYAVMRKSAHSKNLSYL